MFRLTPSRLGKRRGRPDAFLRASKSVAVALGALTSYPPGVRALHETTITTDDGRQFAVRLTGARKRRDGSHGHPPNVRTKPGRELFDWLHLHNLAQVGDEIHLNDSSGIPCLTFIRRVPITGPDKPLVPRRLLLLSGTYLDHYLNWWRVWPDRGRVIGERYLGKLSLSRNDAEALWDRMKELMQAVTATGRNATLRSVLGWNLWSTNHGWWHCFTGLYALAVVEFSYWEPDIVGFGDGGDGHSGDGFWSRWHRFIGDPRPDVQSHHDASRTLVWKGLEVWGVRTASEGARKYVDSVWMQNGLPKVLHPDFIELAHQLGSEIGGWEALADEDPVRIVPQARQIGRRYWAGRSLRHALCANGDWDNLDPDVGVLLRDLARVELLRRRLPQNTTGLSESLLRGAGVNLEIPEWKRFRGRADLVTQMYRGLLEVEEDRFDDRETGPETLRAGLGWSPELGIAVWLESQQIAWSTFEGVAPERLKVYLRVGRQHLLQAEDSLTDEGHLSLVEVPVRASWLGQSVWWEVRDGIGVVARSRRLLTPKDDFIQIDGERVVHPLESDHELIATKAMVLPETWRRGRLVLVGSRAAPNPTWPAGVRAAQCRVRDLTSDWVAWHLTLEDRPVILPVRGGRGLTWQLPGELARLCGLVASPTPTPPGQRVRYLERPTLWLPDWLAGANVRFAPLGEDVSEPAPSAGDAPEDLLDLAYGQGHANRVPWDEGKVTIQSDDYEPVLVEWVVARPTGPGRPFRPVAKLVDQRDKELSGELVDGAVQHERVAVITHTIVSTLQVHVSGLWPGERVGVFVCRYDGSMWHEQYGDGSPQQTFTANDSGTVRERIVAHIGLATALEPRGQEDLALVVRGGVWPRGACLALVRGPVRDPDHLDAWERRLDALPYGRIARAMANLLRRADESIVCVLHRLHRRARELHQRRFEQEVRAGLTVHASADAPWSSSDHRTVNPVAANDEAERWRGLFTGLRRHRDEQWGCLRYLLETLQFDVIPSEAPTPQAYRIQVGLAAPGPYDGRAKSWLKLFDTDAELTLKWARTIAHLTHSWRDPDNPHRPQVAKRKDLRDALAEYVAPSARPDDRMIDGAVQLAVDRGDIEELEDARYAPARPIVVTSVPTRGAAAGASVLFGDCHAIQRIHAYNIDWRDRGRPTLTTNIGDWLPTITMQAWIDSLPTPRVPAEDAAGDAHLDHPLSLGQVESKWPSCLDRPSGRWVRTTRAMLARPALVSVRNQGTPIDYAWWTPASGQVSYLDEPKARMLEWAICQSAGHVSHLRRADGTDGTTEFQWRESEREIWKWRVPDPYRAALLPFIIAISDTGFIFRTDEVFFGQAVFNKLHNLQ